MNAHRLTISHADTCLPDYWSGHHLAHVSIPVYPGMTPANIRAALHSEVSASAFAGNAYTTLETDEWHAACHAAIDAMTFHSGDGATYFNHLDDSDDDDDYSVYAYFVFVDDGHEPSHHHGARVGPSLAHHSLCI